MNITLNKTRIFALVLIAVILVSPLAPAGGTTKLLINENYLDVVHKLISEAEKSVAVYMYFIIASSDRGFMNPVDVLVEDLIKAEERGVTVSVFLENRKIKESRAAYQRLTQKGVRVEFDTPKRLLHAKTVIVDDRYCVIGSTNWSRTAIESSFEISALIDSEELAREIKEYFSGLEIAEKPLLFSGISVPYGFLLNHKAASKMFKDHASKAFDLYLLLLRKSQQAGSGTISFNYREIALGLGYPEFNRKISRGKNENEYYHLKIRKPFRALKANYHLIDYDTLRDRKVRLLPIESSQSFILPYNYWDYNYSISLSFRAKYMYLIALLETHKNKECPFWFRTNKSLAVIYNISTNPISLGFLELERENIIEVTRSMPMSGKYEGRPANVYRVNELVSPEQFSLQIDKMNERYGVKITEQARNLASQINCPKDMKKIEGLIVLIQEYGYPEVLEAVEVAAGYKKGTGLYSIETVYSLLETPSVVQE